MTSDHEAWLAARPEEPVDGLVPICDPHHHLWDHPGSRYLLAELRADTSAGHNVVSTVFVECMSGYRSDGPPELRPVGETEFVADIAAASAQSRAEGAVIGGIVGFADLTLGEAVAPVLDAHVEAGIGLFRGIRHAATFDTSPDIRNGHTDPPPGLLADEAFGRGLATLGAKGLTFDAWVYHHQLAEVADLARRHPDVPIVLDHLGGPLGIGPYTGRRDEVLEDWRAAMIDVAACPNVSLKLGGIGMSMFGLGFHRRDEPPSSDDLAAAWGEPIRWCIERFGVDRAMFESNFPVDRRSCSYTVLWNAFQKITAGASEEERRALFHDTAARFYRVEVSP